MQITAAHVIQRLYNVEDLLYFCMLSTHFCYLILSLSFLRFHIIHTFNFKVFLTSNNHLNSINTEELILNSPCSKISFVLWPLPLFFFSPTIPKEEYMRLHFNVIKAQEGSWWFFGGNYH